MSVVVCNSTPLIYLAAIGKFELLRLLHGRIHIPLAVFDEVVVQGGNRWGAIETAQAQWIERRSVSDVTEVNKLQSRLHGGESELIVLADELNADRAIIDDLAARGELRKRGRTFVVLLCL